MVRGDGLSIASAVALLLFLSIPSMLPAAEPQGTHVAAGAALRFESIAPMHEARAAFALVPFANGTLLAVGGLNGAGILSSMERYDPSTGEWREGPSLLEPRAFLAWVRLPDSQVMVAGGLGPAGALRTTELFDPTRNIWTPGPPLGIGRIAPALTLLSSGAVLISGGGDPLAPAAAATTELLRPYTARWEALPPMAVTRTFHFAGLLADGAVLVAGGSESALTEQLDPASLQWEPAGDLTTPRGEASGLVLASGDVVLSGGLGLTGAPLASTELFDAATGMWRVGPQLREARAAHTATPLPTGEWLLVGSWAEGVAKRTTEIYSPRHAAFSEGPLLNEARGLHGAALLPDGTVVVAGGHGQSGYLTGAERLTEQPAPPPQPPCGFEDLIRAVQDGEGYAGASSQGLLAKALAAQELVERGRVEVALHILEAFRHELLAFRSTGHLTEESYWEIGRAYQCLVGALGGAPGPL